MIDSTGESAVNDITMVKIYRAYAPNNLSYIGSTSQAFSARISQHKFQAKVRPWGIQDLLQDSYNIEDIEFEILEACSESKRFEREKYWLSKYKNVNKCEPSIGPLGFKPKPYQIEKNREIMTLRWKNQRSKMLKNVNSHKDRKFQKMASAASHKAKYEKLPLFDLIDKKTKKKIGQFKTGRELASLLGIHESTALKYKSGKLKIARELYEFRRVSQ